jgi:hypothetical protein
VREGGGVVEVVDGDDLELTSLGERCAKEVAADAAEPVDTDFDAQ